MAEQNDFNQQVMQEFRANQGKVAQFIGVCSSAKTYAIGENLLSVSDPIS